MLTLFFSGLRAEMNTTINPRSVPSREVRSAWRSLGVTDLHALEDSLYVKYVDRLGFPHCKAIGTRTTAGDTERTRWPRRSPSPHFPIDRSAQDPNAVSSANSGCSFPVDMPTRAAKLSTCL